MKKRMLIMLAVMVTFVFLSCGNNEKDEEAQEIGFVNNKGINKWLEIKSWDFDDSSVVVSGSSYTINTIYDKYVEQYIVSYDAHVDSYFPTRSRDYTETYTADIINNDNMKIGEDEYRIIDRIYEGGDDSIILKLLKVGGSSAEYWIPADVVNLDGQPILKIYEKPGRFGVTIKGFDGMKFSLKTTK